MLKKYQKTIFYQGFVRLAVGLSLLSASGKSEGALEEGFRNPPPEARSQTWWHWIDGYVTKEGITADLEAMARVGIGGAQIFSVGRGFDKERVAYNSPAWRELVCFAAAEAKRLGLDLGLHNCAGWSSSGGPWVTPEHNMQVVVASERVVKGPSRFAGVLEQPPAKLGHYRDIALLAVRRPGAAADGWGTPQFTASDPSAKNLGWLADGDEATTVKLVAPRSEKQPTSVTVAYDRQVTVRSLWLRAPGSFGWKGRVESSVDGETFTPIATFTLPRHATREICGFAPVTARQFRLAILKCDSRMKYVALGELRFSPMLAVDQLSLSTFESSKTRSAKLAQSEVPFAAGDVIAAREVLDLTGRMMPDGHLTWDVPASEWLLLRFGHTANGMKNHPVAETGEGLECDKLSREALQAFWDGSLGPLIRQLGPLAGTSFNNLLIDSYEVGSQSWTPKMREEFKRLRGYDPLPYLPTLLGYVVGSPEITERFLWDFRRTVADLFAENYSKAFKELAHAHNIRFALESYGGAPCDDIQCGGFADIPMGEFWHTRAEKVGDVKIGGTTGHVYGRTIIGAEAFTAAPEYGRWTQTPFDLKSQGDLSWCNGITRFYFHTYAHQPWVNPSRTPGMTMGQWGT